MEIEVYPNPYKDILYLHSESFTGEKLDISIYSITGRKLFQEAFTLPGGNTTLSLNLAFLNKGMYILRLVKGHKEANIRIFHK